MHTTVCELEPHRHYSGIIYHKLIYSRLDITCMTKRDLEIILVKYRKIGSYRLYSYKFFWVDFVLEMLVMILLRVQ